MSILKGKVVSIAIWSTIINFWKSCGCRQECRRLASGRIADLADVLGGNCEGPAAADTCGRVVVAGQRLHLDWGAGHPCRTRDGERHGHIESGEERLGDEE